MDDKDVIIAQQRKQIKALLERIKELEEEIARLKKNSSNSSKPPSSDIVKPKKTVRKVSRQKRKRGGQFGHRKFERQPFKPEEIDETIEYELKDQDAVGLEPLDDWFVIQQIELPEKLFTIIEHKARKYLDPVTGQIHIAPLPEAIRRGGLLGARFTALIAFMKAGCHASYGTVRRFCKEMYGLEISRGMLSKVVQKVSCALKEPYEQLYAQLPYQEYLGVDETGHKDQGKLHWTWCFQSEAFSVFYIDHSRGSQVLKQVLGETFAGTLGCDYYGAYRKYMREGDVTVQYCMAHLIREIRFLAEHKGKKLSGWGGKLLAWLKKLFQALHQQANYTAGGLERRMEKIKEGFLRQVRRPPDHKLAKKLSRRFRGSSANNYFVFLTDPNVAPTNNDTEREIRHVVIDRHVTQGTRGTNGMHWCQRAWTIIATCKKQNRNVFEYIHKAIIALWTGQEYPTLLT
jgi:transposase